MMTNPLRHFFHKTGDHAISPRHFEEVLKREGFKDIRIRYMTLHGHQSGFLVKANDGLVETLKNGPFSWVLRIVSPWFMIAGVKDDG